MTALVGDDQLTQTPAASAAPAPPVAPGAPAAPVASPSTGAATTSTSIAAPASPTAETPAPPASPAPNSNGLTVAYVKHTKPPSLIDTTPAKASFAMIGAFAAISAGHDIVAGNNIEDPSGDMARDIASAYAAARGAEVLATPILVDQLPKESKTTKLSTLSGGARYIVEVYPPGMNLIYFPLDWTHFDLLFNTIVRITDTSNNTVVAHAYCVMKPTKSPDLMGHEQLLADQAEELKQLIVRKSQACVAKMKADLSI
jgi:hypothetical protein